MRRFVPILMCLILLIGGLCSGFCLAQTTTPDAAHSCCHGKNHCEHAAPSMQSHPAVTIFQPMPAIVAAQPHSFAPEPFHFDPGVVALQVNVALLVPLSLTVLRL
jgi:hypothetical protein